MSDRLAEQLDPTRDEDVARVFGVQTKSQDT